MSADKRKPFGQERRSAKELLKLVLDGDAAAIARVRKFIHAFDPTDFSLMTAQHVIAREAGHQSWDDILHVNKEKE